MRVSVVMAAFNAEAYLAEAIDSLLGQSRPPDEVIVIDDGSRDRTRAILEQYGARIRSISQSNAGQATALNRALAIAGGDVLGFCDADDLWTPHKLERQAACLQASADIDAVFGQVRQFVSPDVPPERRDGMRPAIEVLNGETKLCLLIRRVAFDRVGPFDETLPATFFIEWLGRGKQRGLRYLMLDEIVALRRLHVGNGGRTNARSQDQETLLALRQVIAGRRTPP